MFLSLALDLDLSRRNGAMLWRGSLLLWSGDTRACNFLELRSAGSDW